MKNGLGVFGASILSVLLFFTSVYAQDISKNQITASTSMTVWNGYDVEQIVDGISTDCAPVCNGFTTDSNRGVIRLAFDKLYDVDGFKLWNDVNLRKEGIKTFILEFDTADRGIISSREFTAVSAQHDTQVFTFQTVQNVTSVNLRVLSSLNEDITYKERIEVREIAFTGVPSNQATLETSEDRTPPSLSFSPSALTVSSAETATSVLTATDKHGATLTPLVRCTNGGSFSGTTFVAPVVTIVTPSVCTAGAVDAAGVPSSASLIVNVLPPKPPTPPWIIPASLAVLAFGLGILFWLTRRRAAPRKNSAGRDPIPIKLYRPSKPLKRPDNAGVIFPASPMVAGNVAAPLAPAGQLSAAHLQMLTGPYAVLKDAYQATGRIGYAQEGVPSVEDYAFGTGFLVSDRHVVTNRHVHGLYGHYLLDKTDPGGIEFVAEKDKDASDFVPFNGDVPLLLPGLDIAIYTLARPVTNRAPIALNTIQTEDLLARDVVVIGYPDTHNPKNPEVLAVVEEDPIFAVKRLSQGQIFRHSTDTDTPLGVETSVSENESSNFLMPAICHNASTMGGNSGSPLLDIKTGQLVGVHFAGFKIFNREEAANLAMAIAQLADIDTVKKLRA